MLSPPGSWGRRPLQILRSAVPIGAPQALPFQAGTPIDAATRPSREARSSTLVAHLRLARPGDNLFAFVGTLLGAGLAGVPASAWSIAAVAISNALLSAGSMMINDWHDVAEDAVNRPDRPIPSGAVPRPRALAMGVGALAAGCAVATVAGWRFAAAAVVITGLSGLYTSRLKAIPLLGNGVIGLLSAYPLWCWYALDGHEGRVYLGAAAAFFVAGVGREMVRTAGDAAGDAARGLRTVATRWGAGTANRCGFALILSACLVAWFTALGSTLIGYRVALALCLVLLVGVGGSRLLADPPARASSRVTAIARGLTVLLALGVAGDLLAGGWGPR